MALRRDKYTQNSNVKEIFTDFLLNFDMNPDTKDLYRNINLYAIMSSIKALMLTDRGERFFQPKVGSSIRRQIFELYTNETVEILKSYIKGTIEGFEPRVAFENCVIVPSEDANALHITIFFSTIQNPGVVYNVSVLLTKVR